MFADQTLTPKEAIRLAALGMLATKPHSYADLAMAIRHFVSRVVGPTPEIMGHSIELLKYEGLVETLDGGGDEPVLGLTPAGREAMRYLLTASIRATSTELNKLIVALKFRFLHLLGPAEQAAQVELLIDACESELARLEDLRDHSAAEEGFLAVWLDHDLALIRMRVAWLGELRSKLQSAQLATGGEQG
jgi:DNA-binding PadR family transcriptional regulator